MSIFQNLLIHSLSLSVINSFNSLWLLINSCSIMYVNTDAVIIFLKNTNIVYFVNQLTIIKMLSNVIFHTEFFDDNNFTMKFIVIDVQKVFSAFSHVTSSYCLLWLILFYQQKLHWAMYCQILLQQFYKLCFSLNEILSSFNF